MEKQLIDKETISNELVEEIKKLTKAIDKGFSKSNLFNMRRFYLVYSKIPDMSGILR